jgi:hypothetical protein
VTSIRGRLAGVLLVALGACDSFGSAPEAKDSGTSNGPSNATDGGEGEVDEKPLPDVPPDLGCRARPFKPPKMLLVPADAPNGVLSYRRVGTQTVYAGIDGNLRTYRVDAQGHATNAGGGTTINVGNGSQRDQPALHRDSLSLLFEAIPEEGPAGLRLHFAQRLTLSDRWTDSKLTILDLVPGPEAEKQPWVVRNASLYFTGTIQADDDDLFLSKWSGSVWLPATMIKELSTNEREGFPIVATDELEIFYAFGPKGSSRIYRATRATLDLPFEPGEEVKELGTPLPNDRPTWLSADACSLYFIRAPTKPPTLWRADR